MESKRLTQLQSQLTFTKEYTTHTHTPSMAIDLNILPPDEGDEAVHEGVEAIQDNRKKMKLSFRSKLYMKRMKPYMKRVKPCMKSSSPHVTSI